MCGGACMARCSDFSDRSPFFPFLLSFLIKREENQPHESIRGCLVRMLVLATRCLLSLALPAACSDHLADRVLVTVIITSCMIPVPSFFLRVSCSAGHIDTVCTAALFLHRVPPHCAGFLGCRHPSARCKVCVCVRVCHSSHTATPTAGEPRCMPCMWCVLVTQARVARRKESRTLVNNHNNNNNCANCQCQQDLWRVWQGTHALSHSESRAVTPHLSSSNHNVVM